MVLISNYPSNFLQKDFAVNDTSNTLINAVIEWLIFRGKEAFLLIADE